MAEPESSSNTNPGQDLNPPPKPGAPDLKFSEGAPLPLSAKPTPQTSPIRPNPPTTTGPSPVAPKEFKSIIRTMADDIAKLKVGQQPSGTHMQKSVVSPPIPPRAETPLPPRAPSSIPFSLPERPRSLSPLPSVPTPGPTPQLLPESPKRSRTVFYLLTILGILLVGVMYLFLRPGKESEIVVSPTPEETATPISSNLSAIFGIPTESINIITADDAQTDFVSKIKTTGINAGQLKPITIAVDNQPVDPFSLLDRLSVDYPNQVKNTIGSDTLTLVYGQREYFDSKGQLILNNSIRPRIVFIIETTDPITLGQITMGWEASMANVLAKLLETNKTKAASQGFLTNVYQETTIRYQNFPFPDLSIDYAITTGTNGKSYFILSNSREAIYTTLDRLH